MLRLLLPAVLLAVTAPAARALDAKDLAGEYKVVSSTTDGKEMPKDQLDAIKGVTIADNTFILQEGEKKIVATVEFDFTKTPSTIEFKPTDGPEKGRTFPGIFKYENGKLTVAINESGTRPKDFKGTAKDDTVIVMEKVKK